MTKESIQKKFEKHGYKIVLDFNGTYVIKSPFSTVKAFKSLNAAHRYWFKKHW